MSNTFFKQLKGFFLSNLKIQLRNPTIIILGFLLPICTVFCYQYVITNTLNRTRIGYKSAEIIHYKKAIEYINFKEKSFELKEFSSEAEIDTALVNDIVDLKLWYTVSGTPSIIITSKDNNNLKNKLLEKVILNKINEETIKENFIKNDFKVGVNTSIIKIDIASLLEPLLPFLLAFAIVISCLSGNDLNIFNKRDNQALKRIFVAPTYPTAYLAGQALARIIFCIIQIMFLFSTIIFFFGYRPLNVFNIIYIFFTVIILNFVFILQNIIISSLVKDNRALNIVNTLILCLQLLAISGLIPFYNFSPQLQGFVNILPLSLFSNIINNITTSASFSGNIMVSNTLGILVWLVILGFLAKKFYTLNQD